jgi:hypothetical protein
MYRNLRALSVLTNLFNLLYIGVYMTADRTIFLFCRVPPEIILRITGGTRTTLWETLAHSKGNLLSPFVRHCVCAQPTLRSVSLLNTLEPTVK